MLKQAGIISMILQSPKIDGWECEQCSMSGAISWSSSEKLEYVIMATPGWECADNEVPIAITEDGEYSDYGKIELEGRTLSQRLETYRDVMRIVIKQVVNGTFRESQLRVVENKDT